MIFQERETRRQAGQTPLANVGAFIDDPAFRDLLMQRAMYTDATEKIAGLSKLRESDVSVGKFNTYFQRET